MKKFILLLLLGAALPALAQDDYAVTLKSDTLRGKIHILSYDLIDRVAIKGEGKKKTLTALEVRIIYLDSTVYAPVQFDNTIRFMQVLKTGYLSLYAFKIDNSYTFDGRLLVKMNGSKLEVPNINFKRLLSEFLKDCPSVSEKVKDGVFARDQLDEIINTYNDCVKDQNEKTIIAVADATPLTNAIIKLKTKVDESSLESKKDVLDLLTNIDAKARLKEPIPGYLTEGLKSYLAGKPEFEQELNAVMNLIN